jgi:hypothetical protein
MLFDFRMQVRPRSFGWFVLIVALSASGCGGDDEAPPIPEPGLDAGSDGKGPGPEAGGEAAADVSIEEARPDMSIQADVLAADAVSEDASPGDESPPSDASLEARADGADASDVVRPTDADAGESVTDASITDASITDARVEAGGQPDGDVGAEETLPVVPEESFFEASVDGDAGAIDDGDVGGSAEVEPESGGDGEGSAPELVHWSIEASPPECSTDLSQVSCTDGATFRVQARTNCPMDISEIDLWFPAGGPPAASPPPHPIHAAASYLQALAVTGNEVAMEITRVGTTTQAWWAQSGTVDVQLDGNRRIIQFTGVAAFLEANHATTTTLSGFLICP